MLFRKTSTTLITGTLVLGVLSLDCFQQSAKAQKKNVPKEPAFQVVDTSTGKTIPEVLIIPLYSHYAAIFIAPEGQGVSTYHLYLDHPFIYRAGEPFKIKQPRGFTGLPLLMVFIRRGTRLGRYRRCRAGVSPYVYSGVVSQESEL